MNNPETKTTKTFLYATPCAHNLSVTILFHCYYCFDIE